MGLVYKKHVWIRLIFNKTYWIAKNKTKYPHEKIYKTTNHWILNTQSLNNLMVNLCFSIRDKSTQSCAHIMRSLNLIGIYSRQMDPRIWHKVAALSGKLYSLSKWALQFLPLNAKFVCQTGISALCLGTYGAHAYKPQNPAFKEVFLLWVNVFTLGSMKRGSLSEFHVVFMMWVGLANCISLSSSSHFRLAWCPLCQTP